MPEYVIAIDQGTTSSRALVFDHEGRIVSSGQVAHHQVYPRPGWVEHDPMEIVEAVRTAIGIALAKANVTRHSLAAVGITNQRETTVIWDKFTGRPVYNAIVWQDTRTQDLVDQMAAERGRDCYLESVGLPLASYFSASKVRWILDTVPGARRQADQGRLLFGTMDSWLVWNLTGGVDGGVHVTDVTNASRTLFLDLRTLQWRDDILDDFGVPAAMMPRVASSSEIYGVAEPRSLLRETPIAGILGDQQAALFGQTAFDAGEAKCTYGTGNFIVVNTGATIARSDHGLLTTVAYRIGQEPARYALEGSIAVTGALVQWLRDSLGIIESSEQIEALARSVPDNGGAYIVPAFSGLYAPHWRPDARGVVVGLTGFVNRAHIARAALEAIAYQTSDVVDAVAADCGRPLAELRVDGGATVDEILMQFQADILNIPLLRPTVTETTALGAAYAAGLAVGFWSDRSELRANWRLGARWHPDMSAQQRATLLGDWAKAVQRSLDWVDTPSTSRTL